MIDETSLKRKIASCSNWHLAFELGKELADHPEGGSDALALSAFKQARLLGLNIHADGDSFVEMMRREARISYLRGDYVRAENAFVLWDSTKSELPLWARLLRCATSLQCPHGPSLYALKPSDLFKEFDTIPPGDRENEARRNAILLTALSKWTELKGTKGFSLDPEQPLRRAIAFGLEREDTVRAFRDAFAPDFALPEPPPPLDPEVERLSGELASAKEALGRTKAELKTLRERNKRQTETNRDWSIRNKDLDRQASELRTQNRLLRDQIDALRSISTTRGKSTGDVKALQAQVEELKAALKLAEEERDGWSDDSVKSTKRAEAAEEVIKKRDREIQKLQGTIQALESRNADLQWRLDHARVDSSPKESTLEDFDSTAEPDQRMVIEKALGRKKILVIGAFERMKNDILRTVGEFGFREGDFRWETDYAKLPGKGIDPASSTFCGIIYGPAPHSMSGKGNENSLLDVIRKGQGRGYPLLAESVNSKGQLDASTTAFRNAFGKIWQHLASAMT